jgi:predicted dehydrogenase
VLHSIVQRSPKPGSSAPSDYPGIKHFTSAEELFADTEVDAVVITTPPDTHFLLAMSALNSGKHVLVEKPFVPSSAEGAELAALASAKGLVLCVYQNRRWDSDFLSIQRLLAAGTLGRVVEFETHFDRFRPLAPVATWKASLAMSAGGGVLYDLGTHLIDQVFLLFGVPTAVYGRFVNQREGRLDVGENPDSVTAVLSYEETGMLVHVRIGVVSAESAQMRFWVRGTKGSYHKTGLDPQEGQLRGGMKTDDTRFGREDASKAGRLCLVKDDGTIADEQEPAVEPETYLKFYQLFAESLETCKEDDIPVPATQAVQVLRILEAVKESARSGKEVSLH